MEIIYVRLGESASANAKISTIGFLEPLPRFCDRVKCPAILPTGATNLKIAIIGPGRLGAALARALSETRYPVTEVISRNNASSLKKARILGKAVNTGAATIKSATCDAGLLWLCVPDREIATVGRELTAKLTGKQWKGKVVFHSSGAFASDELESLKKKGASIASVHPFMTFVGGTLPSLRGVPFAIEGDVAAVRLARQIVKVLGGEAFSVRKKDKVAYHAWATFCSPLLIAALVTAEQVGRIAGLSPAIARRKMLPILKQTFVNYASLGPAGAFSGPIVRGDAETVSKHLKVLQKVPEARAVYLALARSAMRHLPTHNRAKLGKTLNR
jgi:predicted short-subunit dehydrogenase-like oxidoreductase (DUF2520 family)